MTDELDTKKSCLLMRSGIEIWLPTDKAEMLMNDLEGGGTAGFIRLEDRFINLVDISGIFKPAELEEHRKRQRGMWKCKYNNWHSRNEMCECGRVH